MPAVDCGGHTKVRDNSTDLEKKKEKKGERKRGVKVWFTVHVRNRFEEDLEEENEAEWTENGKMEKTELLAVGEARKGIFGTSLEFTEGMNFNLYILERPLNSMSARDH